MFLSRNKKIMHTPVNPRGLRGSKLYRHFFVMEIDHEIFPKVIFSLPLIQEVQLLVSGKKMCTSTG